jgi:hypothetical protein
MQAPQARDFSGLLPLLPLTDDGARHEAIEGMVALLVETGKRDLVLLGYTFDRSFGFAAAHVSLVGC